VSVCGCVCGCANWVAWSRKREGVWVGGCVSVHVCVCESVCVCVQWGDVASKDSAKCLLKEAVVMCV